MGRLLPGQPLKQCRGAAALLLGLVLSACGGGGSGGMTTPPLDSDRYAATCAIPRTGLDPFNDNRPYPDRAGTLADERNWVRAYLDEIYLWFDEIPTVNAASYTVANYGSVRGALKAYFDALRTPALTPSGEKKDRYHYIVDTAEALAMSEGGVAVGYGVQFVLLKSTPPRETVIAYLEPDAPTDTALLARGQRVVAVDGVDFVNAPSQAEVDVINAAMFPETPGEQHQFTLQRGDLSTFTVTLTAQSITQTPVQNVRVLDTPEARVGYLLFNDHVATSESLLIAAMTQFRDAGIDDLVLDLRYNGGGYLDIAGELAYMIAGATRTSGKIFQKLQFNDHNPRANADNDIPFHSTAIGFDPAVNSGAPLPVLDLPRVFMLTTHSTCSASEALLNGLRGVDVEVVQIGGTTCGKPYGFYSTDNCGLTYYAIEFAGVNAKNFGDYADGFAPNCAASDDYTHALGDPNETLLAKALAYRVDGNCGVALKSIETQAPQMIRSPLREIGIRRGGREN